MEAVRPPTIRRDYCFRHRLFCVTIAFDDPNYSARQLLPTPTIQRDYCLTTSTPTIPRDDCFRRPRLLLLKFVDPDQSAGRLLFKLTTPTIRRDDCFRPRLNFGGTIAFDSDYSAGRLLSTTTPTTAGILTIPRDDCFALYWSELLIYTDNSSRLLHSTSDGSDYFSWGSQARMFNLTLLQQQQHQQEHHHHHHHQHSSNKAKIILAKN